VAQINGMHVESLVNIRAKTNKKRHTKETYIHEKRLAQETYTMETDDGTCKETNKH